MANQNHNHKFIVNYVIKYLILIEGYQSHLRSRQHKINLEKINNGATRDKIDKYERYLDTLPDNINVITSFDDYSYSEYNIEYPILYDDDNDYNYDKDDYSKPFTILFDEDEDRDDYSIPFNILFKEEPQSYEDIFTNILTNYYKIFKKSFKFYITSTSLYVKHEEETIVQRHTSHAYEIHNDNNINSIFDMADNYVTDLIVDAELRESGWRYVSTISRTLVICKYKNNTGGSYIQLPFRSSYIINIQNRDDNKCFLCMCYCSFTSSNES